MQKEYSAGIIIFYESYKKRYYLLLHYTAGHWDFAKGHMEQNETKQQAALRELKEETGLVAQIVEGFQETITYFHDLPETQERAFKTVYFFLGRVDTQHITLSHEHSDYAWLTYKQALEQLTYANAKDLLKKAENVLQKRT